MRRLLLPFLVLFSAPAVAQEVPDAPATPASAPAKTPDAGVFAGDYLIVGVGVLGGPSYVGSNTIVPAPAVGIMGHVAGIDFSPRPAGLALDFMPERPGQRLGFSFGPVLQYQNNRHSNIKDVVVERLGKLDSLFQGGVSAGVTLHGVLSSYDRISVGSDFVWDISGKGSGMVISPGVTYFAPLSKAQVVGARAGLEFADGRFSRYNYSVSPAGSIASGLPQYTAHGGLQEVSVGAFTARDLSGNFLDGGFAIGAGVMYTRLEGSAADTPITAIRGSRNQWYFGTGLAYTF